jgi:hypothetical protein
MRKIQSRFSGTTPDTSEVFSLEDGSRSATEIICSFSWNPKAHYFYYIRSTLYQSTPSYLIPLKSILILYCNQFVDPLSDPFLSRFQIKRFNSYLKSPMSATWFTPVTLHDLITLTIFGEQFRLWSHILQHFKLVYFNFIHNLIENLFLFELVFTDSSTTEAEHNKYQLQKPVGVGSWGWDLTRNLSCSKVGYYHRNRK